MSAAERTLVLGLGNPLLRDDAVGLLAARRVAELAGDVRLAEACGATVDLLPIITGYDRVVVLDAYVSAGHPPGTPRRSAPDEHPCGFGYRSFHTFPFDEMLALGRALGMAMPREVVLHGLSVADPFTFGVGLSPTVAAAWRDWAADVARREFGAVPSEVQRPA